MRNNEVKFASLHIRTHWASAVWRTGAWNERTKVLQELLKPRIMFWTRTSLLRS